MISHITQAFRTMFTQLPVQIQQQEQEAYKLFQQNPSHPSLRWKHVHPTKPIYSVRVGLGRRRVLFVLGDIGLYLVRFSQIHHLPVPMLE